MSETPRALDVVRSELKSAEEELRIYQEGERLILERVQRLRRAERELSSGALSSSNISDDQIVQFIRANSSADQPKTTPEIAAHFGGNGKGFSRRLKRMAEKDKVIAGSSTQGYYVPGV